MTKIIEAPLSQNDPITKQVVENVRRRHGEVEVRTDEKGNKHYTMHVDPAVIGMELSDTNKNAPSVNPRRPTFRELVDELNKKSEET
jgi:hypothetical protein